MDKEANAHGGMLVIATSIPDEREWIQWKGRTARQDRPGQFYVILDEKAKPFNESKYKRLASKLKGMAKDIGKEVAPGGVKVQDEMVTLLLDAADDGIGDRLKKFEGEQASGEKLNEMTELYYKEHPREFDDPWPKQEYLKTDAVLRRLLTDFDSAPPKEVVRLAKSDLDLELE